jgi:hypothetical protein
LFPDNDIQFPKQLQVDGYTGEAAAGASGVVSQDAYRWGVKGRIGRPERVLAPAKPADSSDWKDPRVGWGLVLAEKPDLSAEQLADGSDAPEPIRQLLKDRPGSPVFRFRPGWHHQFGLLRNYRDGVDVSITGAGSGVARGNLPRYLLIYGGPDEVPWEMQFLLNAISCVGRLPLKGEALENYVTALRSGWKDSSASAGRSVVWAVNHGSSDISALMRNVLAAPVYEKHRADKDMKSVFLDGAGQATREQLAAQLKESQPGLIVTTSHGKTGPLGKPEEMAADLGLPVDQNFQPVRVSDLLRDWAPGGAIWYAHACCSAGSAAGNHFKGLTGAGSEIERLLDSVAALGDTIAPLPLALLGHRRSARAFIGHVEPTFDWTLKDPRNQQPLGDGLTKALYDELYQPRPVGLAFREHFCRIGGLLATHQANLTKFNAGDMNDAAIAFYLLAARDVRSMVILGDPAAVLPGLQA